MKNLGEINLLSAVIEFTKDPDKYSAYLGSLRKEVGIYEEVLAKYKEFQDAKAYVVSEQAKLDDLRKMLEEGNNQLEQAKADQKAKQAADQTKIGNKEADLTKQLAIVAEKEKKLDKAIAEHQVVLKRMEESQQQFSRQQSDLQARESKLNSKLQALQALIA